MSYKVYPVTKTDLQCDDYEVYVNGERAELNTARVSAYPFNRRWPGHQRQIEQTELINFLSMESNEDVELKIIPKAPMLGIRIRPRDLEAKATVDALGVITIHVTGAAQFTVEPYGRNRALHVFIDPVSAYKVDKTDEKLIYYGAGEHEVGEIYLKSGQTLFLDEGAVVYATVYALHADNIKILGRGILDNSKSKEKILYEANVEQNKGAVMNAKRIHTVNLVCCNHVEVDGITIRDSLLYNICSMSCSHVHINNVKLIGNWRFNSDGVHFANCINSSLSNSFLRTYDDSICVRGFANYDYDFFLSQEREEDLNFVCKDVAIQNCVVWNDWGKNLQVGTETYSNEIANIVFEDCKLIHATGKAVTMWLVDNAKIHDVVFRNTLVEYEDYMLKNVTQKSDSQVFENEYNADFAGYLVYFIVSKHFEYSLIQTEEELGYIHGVKLENLSLYGVQKPNFLFTGANANSTCEDITLDGIYWNGEHISQSFFLRQTQMNEFVKDLKFIEQ